MLKVERQVLADMRDPAVVRRRKILPANRVQRHKTHIGETRNDKRLERRHHVCLSLEVLNRPERLRARRPNDVRGRLERNRLDFLYAPRDRRASANVVLRLDLAHDWELVAVVFARKRKPVEPTAPAAAFEEEPDLVSVREDERLRELFLRNLAVTVDPADVLYLVRREEVGYRALPRADVEIEYLAVLHRILAPRRKRRPVRIGRIAVQEPLGVPVEPAPVLASDRVVEVLHEKVVPPLRAVELDVVRAAGKALGDDVLYRRRVFGPGAWIRLRVRLSFLVGAARIDEPYVLDMLVQYRGEFVAHLHAVLLGCVVSKAKRLHGAQEREPPLLHREFLASPRVVFSSRDEMGDVELADFVEEPALLARRRESRGVAAVLHTVLAAHHVEHVDVEKRQEEKRHKHQQKIYGDLSASHVKAPGCSCRGESATRCATRRLSRSCRNLRRRANRSAAHPPRRVPTPRSRCRRPN